jgi:DNA-binding LacI/PurR family transcriptional regulator
MSKVSISQAAKLAKISRSTLYNKYINTGIISVETVEDKKLIDMSELFRVFNNNITQDSNDTPINTVADSVEQAGNTAKDKIISLLEKQLQEAKEREEWLKAQLEKTTHLLEDKTVKPRKKIFGIF